MEEQWIRKFKHRQKCKAKRISEVIRLELESVTFKQHAKHKQRINIIITFKKAVHLRESDKKAIDSILKSKYIVSNNRIIYSDNPRNKNSI